MSGLCRILMVSFALMSVLTWVVPVAAEHVSVRASRGDDFGRIVFLWDRPFWIFIANFMLVSHFGVTA